MKKIYTYPKLLGLMVILLAANSSCKKSTQDVLNSDGSHLRSESHSSEIPPQNGDCGIDYREDSVGYALCHLTVVGREAVTNFQDQKETVYEYIQQQFDGEDNVLISTLIDPSKGALASSEILTNALSAFENINGDTMYPQIYIPYYEKIKGAGVLGTQDPIIVPYAGQDALQDESYTGYFVGEGGILYEYPTLIDSVFASGHEVWIVSLNESVNNRGELNLDQGEGNGSFYGSRTMGYVNCRINKMIVKEHKESWIGGKSEVAIRAFLWTWNGATNGGNQFQQIDYYSQNSTDDLRGKVIREFKRGEVSDRTEKTVNYNLQNNWEANNYYINPICFGYAIFERDNWPVAVKTAAMTIPTSPVNTPRFMQFRSSDGQYSAGTVYNMPFTMGYGYNSAVQDVGRSNSFLSNRSGIRFNTQEF